MKTPIGRIRLVAALLGLMAGAAAQAKADLVVNGGFETGDLTGWTLTNDPLFTEVRNFAAHDGSWGLASGAAGTPASLTQDLATTAGQSYTFSFWLRVFDGTPNSFEADWDGSPLLQFADSPAFEWTHYSFTVMATSSSTTIQILLRSVPSEWDLDTVSVNRARVAVPEPSTFLLSGAFRPDGPGLRLAAPRALR